MYRIEIANRQKFLEIENDEFVRIVEQSLKHEKIVDAEISVAFVDNDEIHRLNDKFLKHDFATDVLSFLYSAEANRREAQPLLEGEIIVSTEMACAVAKKYAWSAKDEAILYLVHGLLHLIGYDDDTDDHISVMRQKELEILETWGIVEPIKTSIHSSAEI